MPAPGPGDERRGEESDAALAGRIAGGDVEAWGLLFERHFDEIHRLALYGTDGDAETAKDLSQQTFLECVRTIGGFRGSSLRKWLAGILRNLLARHWRKTSRINRHMHHGDVASVLNEKMDSADLPGEVAASKETGMILRRALALVEPNHSEVLVGRYIEEKGVPRLASELGISEAGVHSLLFRAREALRNAMRKVSDDFI